MTIRVPKASTTTGGVRRARYLSPATQSMTLQVTQHSGGATVLNQTVGLTPTATGCSSSLATTICTLTISLSPGTYDAALATYDGPNATGNELSAGQTVGFTVSQGQANTLALTLSGIPASLQVASGAPAVHGSQDAGFTLYGISAQKLVVEALDVDGNVIVGPGSPTFTAGAQSGSGFTITNPTAAAPNTLVLTPPGANGQSETFTLAASYADGTCSTTGAVCSATFAVKNDVQTLFIANYDPTDTVTVYAPPYTGAPSATISNGVGFPDALAVDAANDLFVANASTVTEYAAPYTGAPSATITNGVNAPAALLLDAHGNLFVANYGIGTVTVYAPPYGGAPITISSGLSAPVALAMDAQGDLFVADIGQNAVLEFAPPYTSAPVATISDVNTNEPLALALDPVGDLFVANSGGSTVAEYAPPYSGAPAVISGGVSSPSSVVLDGANDLFVANAGASTVTEYAPPYSGAPVVTMTSGLSTPVSLVLDGANDVFVPNSGMPSLEIFAPPYRGTPVTIATGGSGAGGAFAAALTP